MESMECTLDQREDECYYMFWRMPRSRPWERLINMPETLGAIDRMPFARIVSAGVMGKEDTRN